MAPRRLTRLPKVRLPDGGRVYLARSLRARLVGLALLPDLPAGCALLIPRCSSVHTFGMRFPIDVAFLDPEGRALRVKRHVRPCRVVRHRSAAAVLELRSYAAPTSPPSR